MENKPSFKNPQEAFEQAIQSGILSANKSAANYKDGSAMKEIRIKTPYGEKNWSYVKRVFDSHQDLLDSAKIALKEFDSWRKGQVFPEEIKILKAAIARAEGGK